MSRVCLYRSPCVRMCIFFGTQCTYPHKKKLNGRVHGWFVRGNDRFTCTCLILYVTFLGFLSQPL